MEQIDPRKEQFKRNDLVQIEIEYEQWGLVALVAEAVLQLAREGKADTADMPRGNFVVTLRVVGSESAAALEAFREKMNSLYLCVDVKKVGVEKFEP